MSAGSILLGYTPVVVCLDTKSFVASSVLFHTSAAECSHNGLNGFAACSADLSNAARNLAFWAGFTAKESAASGCT